MCGIVGRVELEPSQQQRDPAAALSLIAHRGPDGGGCWISADKRVVLGHRRLAIIDLSPSGAQPMTAVQGQVSLTYNGEIYNFQELRKQLKERGQSFQGGSDTEVLLAAYLEWGTGCLDQLEGMFAFGIYDGRPEVSRRGKLLLARDRVGEKPLYYWHHPGGFSFASELKALMADPQLPRRLDLEALNHYLASGYVPGDKCILAGVKKLPPAHAITYDLSTGEAQGWRYWDVPHPCVAEPQEQSLVEELESLLEASVRRQLVADVPVGILLSGGVDSSLVTALAARCSSSPVKTFTITFPNYGHYDEGPYARRVAEFFATEHHELVAEPTSLNLLPDLARQYDEPLADSSLIPTFLVSKLTREHVKVALGGDGGDELFGGYDHYRAAHRDARVRRCFPRAVRGAFGAVAEKLPIGTKGRNYLLGLRSSAQEAAARGTLFDLHARIRLLSPDAVNALGQQIEAPEEYRLAIWNAEFNLVDNLTRLDFRTYLPDNILVKTDRASMAASLELRAPWLDRRVIEFAFATVPAHLKASRVEKKTLPRRLAEKLLPPDLDWRRKQGFSIPLATWFRGNFGKALSELLVGSNSDLFLMDAIRGLLRGQAAGLSNASRLFCLGMLEQWRREYSIV